MKMKEKHRWKKVIIQKLDNSKENLIEEIVKIHLETFEGFFLTFMGKGFLCQMYKSYISHENSNILVASEDEKPIGFLAYSSDLSGLYKHMIKKRLILFAWYALGAFFRKPKVFMRLVRAFLKPGESRRKEKYIELSSIGVKIDAKSKGVGSSLIEFLKKEIDFSEFEYIKLETDAENNEAVNNFYQKNGFALETVFETPEGRKMNEYRFSGKREHR